MTFQTKVFCLLMPLLAAALFTAKAQGKRSRPNVVIIYLDDMGYGDTEPYGMRGIPAPNFNRW